MKRKIIEHYLRNKVEITIFIGLGTLFNTLLITFGIWNGITQRANVIDSQVKMQYQDSIRGTKLNKVDSTLNTREMIKSNDSLISVINEIFKEK